ncbi:potassium transporter peripheral membrane protein [Clostridia bacterium]|nr:potassium transporter peripheral membrane protein [Clostridia bacterium]GHV31559.1 potassium transporter peripheral membrane protein [Clostridia bacterium]
MKIIVVGGGKVGFAIASQLSRENHDVVIIDRDPDAVKRAADALDVMCVRGNGASGATLKEAGIEDCDMLIASTSGDEMNMVACLTGKTLGAKHTAARIRDPDYARDINRLKRELGISLVINPEQATAGEISRLLRFAGASNVEHFSKGRIEMISVVATEAEGLAGVKVSALRRRIAGGVLFCAYERGDLVGIPHGDTVFEAGDKLYVIGEPSGTMAFCRQHRIETGRLRDLMIVGGGRIGRYLALSMLRLGMSVKVIERDEETCRALSEEMPEAVIIHGDGTDQELLESENLPSTDAFAALTGRDEDNLIVSLYARQRGARKVVAKATRQNYAALTRDMGLSSVVSPKDITASQIVRFVRGLENRGDSRLDAMFRIVRGKADILEYTVGPHFPFAGKPLKDLRQNSNLLVAAIIRDHRALIPNGDTRILAGDSVILAAHGMTLPTLESAWL